jgi:cytochrome c
MFNHILLQTPVPRDLPLDLPLPKEVLIVLLVFSFLLHILFVNLMVGVVSSPLESDKRPKRQRL